MKTETRLFLTIPDIKLLVADWNRSQLQDYQHELVEFFVTDPYADFQDFIESKSIYIIDTVGDTVFKTENELVDIVRDYGHLILPAHVLKLTNHANYRIAITIQTSSSEINLTQEDLGLAVL